MLPTSRSSNMAQRATTLAFAIAFVGWHSLALADRTIAISGATSEAATQAKIVAMDLALAWPDGFPKAVPAGRRTPLPLSTANYFVRAGRRHSRAWQCLHAVSLKCESGQQKNTSEHYRLC